MTERKGTKALELWCRRLLAGYEGVSVDNMTTSWRNGLAFCALVHRFRPDLIDFSSLKPEDVYTNNELAFRTAETHLGIPALLDPEDMVASEVPDRLSILTYLSQFYRRLSHTVPKLTNDNNNTESPPPSPLSPQSPLSTVAASLRLSKSYEVCAACGLPVYLAQRLLVARRLYHRDCFRCGACRSPLGPHARGEGPAGELRCEGCRGRPPDDDCAGMLMYHDDAPRPRLLADVNRPAVADKSSVLDRIRLFEDNEIIKNKKQPDEIRYDWRACDVVDGKSISLEDKKVTPEHDNTFNNVDNIKTDDSKIIDSPDVSKELVTTTLADSSYKSDVSKLSFLQTQLSTEDSLSEPLQVEISQSKRDSIREKTPETEKCDNVKNDILDNTHTTECLESDDKRNSNVPDDVRLEDKLTQSCKINDSCGGQDKCDSENITHPIQDTSDPEIPIIIPPRRRNGANKKSLLSSKELNSNENQNVSKESTNKALNAYPDDLNPFSDDDEEESTLDTSKPTKESTNPFGSSDEEEPLHTTIPGPHPSKNLIKSGTSRENLTPALNPFWSDGEEPSSDEEESLKRSQKSGIYGKWNAACSTPNLAAPRRKKSRPPPPPPPQPPPAPARRDAPVIEIDDTASLSSMSSHCSTINSDYKSHLKLTPKSRKKRPAPTPPDNTSLISSGSGGGNKSSLSQGKNLFPDDADISLSPEGGWRRAKGPAPGLPLPGRRVVRPELTPAALQTQLDLLETQQLGLERQGVLIEQMIRDKCEGEEAEPAPALEVEELVIQLCELVNEKNDLFRKQAELMYIRRQQRLEQEQADIEHEIRIIQSRPAVNRIDADKAREEALVSRLVGVVRLRDELVQQLDHERRRERAEDAAIAMSIAERRAKRNSDSNNSSLQSEEIVRTSKKSKVKDRVKKQFKKAKNTLHPKKKDSEGQSKEHNGEKKEKNKWF